MNEVIRAIKVLRPGIKFSFKKDEDGNQNLSYEYLDWLDESSQPPSKIEVEKEIEKQKSEEYKQKRAIKYPTIGDQLDDLFKAGLFSEEMAAKIQAVKDEFPK